MSNSKFVKLIRVTINRAPVGIQFIKCNLAQFFQLHNSPLNSQQIIAVEAAVFFFMNHQ